MLEPESGKPTSTAVSPEQVEGGGCVSHSLEPDLLTLLYFFRRKLDASVVGIDTTLMRDLCFQDITSSGLLGGVCLARSCLCRGKAREAFGLPTVGRVFLL